jgi:pimeloyl-ACP methyl ester carboxylesterase
MRVDEMIDSTAHLLRYRKARQNMRNSFLFLCMLASASALLPSRNVLAAEASAAQAGTNRAATEIGVHTGAAYRIDIPANWNRNVIVFYHGYAIEPVTFREGDPISPMFDPMLKQGFAVIQSAYSASGWAVEQGYADTEHLRQYFVTKHGSPKQTFAMGMSMGGTLTAMTIETRADVYSGALSLCGAIEPTDRLMQREFALRAAFDYYFPDLLGPLVPVPADYQPNESTERKIAGALASNPHATQSLLRFYGAADASNLAPVIAFITYDTKEMQQRTHANPFGNADLIYTGSGDDFALNDGVRRYRFEASALAYMSRWYMPTGKLLRPMLALHDSGDPLVPASSAFEYAMIAQRAGHGENFVQQYVNKEGHCVFTPTEVGTAFDELVEWVHHGKRPVSGKLQ